jgi:hypothetical protein
LKSARYLTSQSCAPGLSSSVESEIWKELDWMNGGIMEPLD